jgi:hypothetical protein
MKDSSEQSTPLKYSTIKGNNWQHLVYSAVQYITVHFCGVKVMGKNPTIYIITYLLMELIPS